LLCFLDFNFNPSDAAYSLLVGDPLTQEQETDITFSHVVHANLDPSVPIDPKQRAVDEDEEGGADVQEQTAKGAATAESGSSKEGGDEDEENDPDRVIKNARRATPEDGLLEPNELTGLFNALPGLRSVYDEWGSNDVLRTFGARVPIPEGRRGRSDPMYTSYTHFWKATLGTLVCRRLYIGAWLTGRFSDYIFMIQPKGYRCDVEGVLEPALPEEMGAGLPRKDVCGSDHLSLKAHISWFKQTSASEY
jgi:RNA exonuclease NGL2